MQQRLSSLSGRSSVNTYSMSRAKCSTVPGAGAPKDPDKGIAKQKSGRGRKEREGEILAGPRKRSSDIFGLEQTQHGTVQMKNEQDKKLYVHNESAPPTLCGRISVLTRNVDEVDTNKGNKMKSGASRTPSELELEPEYSASTRIQKNCSQSQSSFALSQQKRPLFLLCSRRLRLNSKSLQKR